MIGQQHSQHGRTVRMYDRVRHQLGDQQNQRLAQRAIRADPGTGEPGPRPPSGATHLHGVGTDLQLNLKHLHCSHHQNRQGYGEQPQSTTACWTNRLPHKGFRHIPAQRSTRTTSCATRGRKARTPPTGPITPLNLSHPSEGTRAARRPAPTISHDPATSRPALTVTATPQGGGHSASRTAWPRAVNLRARRATSEAGGHESRPARPRCACRTPGAWRTGRSRRPSPPDPAD